jgi:hypothetical protein
VVVLNLEVSFFLTRIREKLLELDFDGPSDVDEAATTHAGVLRIDDSRDQNALVDRLQTDIQIEFGTGLIGHDPLSPGILQGHGELMFAHLSRLADDVADGEDERTTHSGTHPAMVPAARGKRLASG